MMYEGTEAFFKKYQDRAKAEGVDPLGYYLGGWGYAYIQVLGDAVKGANSLEGRQARRIHPQDHLQDHPRPHQVRRQWRVGEGPDAAGAVSRHQAGRRHRVLRGMDYQTVLTPDRLQDRRRDLPLREGEIAESGARLGPSAASKPNACAAGAPPCVAFERRATSPSGLAFARLALPGGRNDGPRPSGPLWGSVGPSGPQWRNR